MKRKLFLAKKLPLSLCGLLLLLMLATVFLQAPDAALTTDEAMHASYGQATLKWYTTLGQDRAFLHYPLDDYEPQHGAIFDVVVAATQRIVHHGWLTEAILTGLSGILGVVAISLCGLELGGWWFALLAGLSLWLYPRFFGALLNNPKDVPFTMANTFVLWSVLLLIRQWEDVSRSLRNSLLVAFFLGIALALRVNAAMWYPLLGLCLGAWWLLHGRRIQRQGMFARTARQQVCVVAIIGIGSFLWTILLWPYIFLNPPGNFYNAMRVIAKYPWNGSVLYQGQMQLAVDLPRSYALVWLVIGSPPGLLLCATLGLGWLCALMIRKRVLDASIMLVLLAFVLPLGMIVGVHSVLYNGLRQFLFLIPPLILLAIYGLMQALTSFWRRGQRLALVLLLLCFGGSLAWTAQDMLDLHPYEYVYFSPLIGGLQGARNNYEIDYWNTCQRAASIWLGGHYQAFVSEPRPTIQASSIAFQYMTFLPPTFQTTQHAPDFLIDIPPFSATQTLANYRLIHTESIQNVPLCRVYVNKQSAPGLPSKKGDTTISATELPLPGDVRDGQ